ncbi:MAG: hypothetical protein ABR616_15690 [Dermatophilaceae bacterium]
MSGWHVIHGETFLDALRRCHEGESPDLVYMELDANAEREDFREDEDPRSLAHPDAQRHVEHARYCSCLTDSGTCCDMSCPDCHP